jgi:hypothetical protein
VVEGNPVVKAGLEGTCIGNPLGYALWSDSDTNKITAIDLRFVREVFIEVDSNPDQKTNKLFMLIKCLEQSGPDRPKCDTLTQIIVQTFQPISSSGAEDDRDRPYDPSGGNVSGLRSRGGNFRLKNNSGRSSRSKRDKGRRRLSARYIG